MYLLIHVLCQKFGVEDTMVANRATAPVAESVEMKNMDLIINSVLCKPYDLE